MTGASLTVRFLAAIVVIPLTLVVLAVCNASDSTLAEKWATVCCSVLIGLMVGLALL